MARRNDDRRAGRSAAGRSTPDLAALGNQRVTLRLSRPRSGGGRVGRERRQPANKNELTRAGILLPRLWSRWEQISGERAALVPGEPLKQPVPVGTGRCARQLPRSQARAASYSQQERPDNVRRSTGGKRPSGASQA